MTINTQTLRHDLMTLPSLTRENSWQGHGRVVDLFNAVAQTPFLKRTFLTYGQTVLHDVAKESGGVARDLAVRLMKLSQNDRITNHFLKNTIMNALPDIEQSNEVATIDLCQQMLDKKGFLTRLERNLCQQTIARATEKRDAWKKTRGTYIATVI